MINIIIFGAPGSGKGTQSAKIIEKYDFVHISTGDVLRREISLGTELGKIANDRISQGKLVPDDLIIEMLERELTKIEGNSKGVIFDGFPRTVEQAASLKKMLSKRGEQIAMMLNLEVEREVLINRLLKRGEISGRSDDNLETIEQRLKVYENITAPVIDFYKQEGCHHDIKTASTIEAIFSNIEKVINKVIA